jgi:hypothetical protein
MIHYSIVLLATISIQAERVAGYSIRSKPYVLLHYYCFYIEDLSALENAYGFSIRMATRNIDNMNYSLFHTLTLF